MIKLSVCSNTLRSNKESGDVTLYQPPIVVWENDIEIKKVFIYEISEEADLVYRPEKPLPNGATVYIEVYE
jgi:hypothetical protein